jgi:hypothetical protein
LWRRVSGNPTSVVWATFGFLLLILNVARLRNCNTQLVVLSFPKIPLDPPFSKGEVLFVWLPPPSESRKLAYLKKVARGDFDGLMDNAVF